MPHACHFWHGNVMTTKQASQLSSAACMHCSPISATGLMCTPQQQHEAQQQASPASVKSSCMSGASSGRSGATHRSRDSNACLSKKLSVSGSNAHLRRPHAACISRQWMCHPSGHLAQSPCPCSRKSGGLAWWLLAAPRMCSRHLYTMSSFCTYCCTVRSFKTQPSQPRQQWTSDSKHPTICSSGWALPGLLQPRRQQESRQLQR